MTPMFRYTLALLLVLVLSIYCVNVYADALYVGQISDHFNDSDKVDRESHPLVVYEWDKEDRHLLVGWWKNSFNKHTFAVGVKTPEIRNSFGEFGFKAGLATGYRVPLFASIYYQNRWLDINWLPGEVISAGFKIDI